MTQTKRFSSVAEQMPLEEATAYLNDTNLWVLGLPTTVTNVATGEVESQNVYDGAKDTLKERWRFGQKLMSYGFDAQGNLASFTDGNGHATTLGSYQRGIPQAIGYPDGTHQSLVVDDFGQIGSITDQAGSTTSYSYDAIGRLTGISYPTGDEQAWYPKTFAYAYVTSAERGLAANHWRRTISQGDYRQVTWFDAELRPVLTDTYSAADGSSHTSARTDYDWRGQKVFVSYPVAGSPDLAGIGTGTRSTYDALGRLTATQQDSERGPLTTATAYLSGARQQVTDPKGNVTTLSYQVFDEPSYDRVYRTQTAAGITHTVHRDVYGNPLTLHQYGSYNGYSSDLSKTLVYDSYHRLCRTTEPETGSTVTAYDGANNVAWTAEGLAITGAGCGQEQVAAGAKTTRTYDALNRVLTLLPPSGTQGTSYTYDALGHVQRAVSGVTTWTGTYNKRGQLTGEALQLDGQAPWAIGYAHDAYGSASLIHYPDGENVSYAPDALGRATRVGSYVSGITYFPNGQVASFQYGNGASYVAEQNARQLLGNFSYGQGGTLAISQDYAYDAAGNITAMTDLVDGTRTKSFGYDALNRLTSATASHLWGTESYAYDPLNNLRSRVSDGATFTYNYDATNRLAAITSGSASSPFTYDNRGNVIGKNGVTLAFDAKNQLTGLPGRVSYAYDASGRRVSKTPQGGSPTYYFYNQAGQLLYQWDTGTAVTTNFIYLGRQLVGDSEDVHLVAPATLGVDANPNNGSYAVSWPAVAGATGYTLQEQANGGGWSTVYTGTATSKAFSGKAGGSYAYQVQACAGSTCTGWTASATVGVTPALPTVTVPAGTVNGSYMVSWTAAGATGYDVQERVAGGSWSTIASNTPATSISRPGTSSGSYSYQVSAKNGYGTRGWAVSGTVTVDTTYGVVPTTPGSLSVPASSSTGGATLSWGSASLATSYTLQQSGNGGTSWGTVYTGSGTSAALGGLADGSYVYQVQACNTYGCSGWKAGSGALVVTHPPGSAPTLNVPASSNTGSYAVSWTAVGGTTYYRLQEQVNGGGWVLLQADGSTSWNASGKGNGTYGYLVQACNAGGCGPWSSVQSVTVLLPPAAPGSLTVPGTSTGSIAVSWAASGTATGYTLQESANGGGWSTVYSGSGTGTTVAVSASGSYAFRVQACNASGCSGWLGSSAVAVTLPPSAAPSLTVPSSNTTGSYAVSWTALSSATSYTLQEQINGGSWGDTYSGGGTSWNASGKGSGMYGYRVQGCNAGGCGPWSTTQSVSVVRIPATPAAPHASYTGTTYKPTVTATWNAVAYATSYQLEQDDPQNGANIVYNGPGTSWTQFVVANGTVTYRVKACSSAGCSAFSAASNGLQLESGAGGF